MNESKPKAIEPKPVGEASGQPKNWRRLSSAPWLFTYGLVVVQVLTFFPFVLNYMPTLWVYVFVAAGLSLAAVVPVWWVAIRHWASLSLGVVVLFVEGFTLASWVPGPALMMFLLPLLVGGTVAIPLLGISWFLGRFDKPIDDGETAQFQEGLRFGIVHLFIASTIVAVICGIGKALAPFLTFSPQEPIHLFAVIILVISFNTLISTWALMGQSVGLRMVVSILLATLSCGGGVLIFQAGVAPAIRLMFGLCWVATTVHLALLRRSGLRFIKKQPNPEIARSL